MAGGSSDNGAMAALLRANMRAAEIRQAGLPYHAVQTRMPGIVRGAPTHDLAFLLTALEEDGWRLRQGDDKHAEVTGQRDFWIRTAMRLDAAINHHADARERYLGGPDEIDEALYAARKKISADVIAGEEQ